MIAEHAITSTKELTVEDLNYLMIKANRLGLCDRGVFGVFTKEDKEGTHYYFQCEEPGSGKQRVAMDLRR